MYELLHPYVNKNSVEQCLETRSETARIPLSDTRSDNDSLNVASIVGFEPDHQGLAPSEPRGWHV